MKLSEYINKLNILLKENGDHNVIYAKDDEGNGFEEVYCEPSAGRFDNGEYDPDEVSPEEINAICVN